MRRLYRWVNSLVLEVLFIVDAVERIYADPLIQREREGEKW